MDENSKRNMGDYGYNSEFPKRLRALMENQNEISPLQRSVTQAELARHLGITRQAVSAYTLGTSVPDMLRFKAIADFFHVNYEYLIGESNVLGEKQSNFVELSGLPPTTLDAILRICSTDDHWLTFMLLVETVQFHEMINALASNLSLIGYNEKWTDQDTLLALDQRVRKETHGALCVTPARLERDRNTFNAQRYLAEAVEAIETRIREFAKESKAEEDSPK